MSDNLKVASFNVSLLKDLKAGKNCQFEAVIAIEQLERELASQQASHEAEIARLESELLIRMNDREVAKQRAGNLELQLSAANAACAMKDAQLLYAIKQLKMMTDYIDKALYAESANEKQAILEEALSYSPQQVSEWERKQLEPLRAQVTALVAALKNAMRMLGGNTSQVEFEILSNTQATAEQFIAECEQRGAVKALEEVQGVFIPDGELLDCWNGYEIGALNVDHKHYGKNFNERRLRVSKHIEQGIKAAILRATSKKAG